MYIAGHLTEADADALRQRMEQRASRGPADLDDPSVLEEMLAGDLPGDGGPGDVNPTRRHLEARLDNIRAAERRKAELANLTPAELGAAIGRGF